jgi:hypothetical protein
MNSDYTISHYKKIKHYRFRYSVFIFAEISVSLGIPAKIAMTACMTLVYEEQKMLTQTIFLKFEVSP